MNKKTIVIILVIILIIPLGINNCILSNSYPTVVENKDWLGFFGSYLGAVLGALITLYVLYHTLKSNEKLHADNKKINIMPYLNFQIELNEEKFNNENYIPYTINFGSNSDIKGTKHIHLTIKNIGLGTAIKFELPPKQCTLNSIQSDSMAKSSIENGRISTVDIIAINEEKNYLLSINFFNELIDRNELILNFTFEDFIGTKYIQRVRIVIFNMNLSPLIEYYEAPKEIPNNVIKPL